ncbi:MAG: DUF4838 domain-containing protein [Clostridia bacterium]|nr:DUF4838 domain-containing protein [Clostridia bacterium]
MSSYTIIQNSIAHYQIVGANLSASCERYAAAELQKYIYRATGVFIPYYSDRLDPLGPEIYIGYKTRNGKEYLTDEELSRMGEDGFLIRTVGKTILITGATPRGTLYGVYEFLRRFLGFRAFTKSVERIDSTDTLVIPDTDILETPDFEYRDSYFRGAWDGAFSAKLRLNSTLADLSAEKGGSFKFFNCHHSFDDLVPPKKYFEDHPEYYCERGGLRMPKQPCLSHPDSLRIAIETLKGWIAENPECRVFSVAQNDNNMYCTCPTCRAYDEAEGSPAASVIRFVNRIAEAIVPDHPSILLHTFAYMYSRHAPRTVRPHPNVIVRLCSIECEWGEPMEALATRNPQGAPAAFLQDAEEWGRITNRLYVWDYATNFRQYLQPFPNFYTLAANIRTFKEKGVRGVLEQGNFSYGEGAALDDLKTYLVGHLLWKAETDPAPLIREFCEGMYGKGAPYILEYIAMMTEAVKGHTMRLFDYPDADYLTDELLRKAEELFAAAEAAEDDPVIRRRIAREHLSVRFTAIARIEDEATRTAETDRFAADVRDHRLTEIMERTHLEMSFDCMRRSRYAKDRKGFPWLYYIMR